jgi:hypothetical protein
MARDDAVISASGLPGRHPMASSSGPRPGPADPLNQRGHRPVDPGAVQCGDHARHGEVGHSAEAVSADDHTLLAVPASSMPHREARLDDVPLALSRWLRATNPLTTLPSIPMISIRTDRARYLPDGT